MSADFNKPSLTSTKASFPTEIIENDQVLAKMFEADATASNKPVGAKRIDNTGATYYWNGSSWVSIGTIGATSATNLGNTPTTTTVALTSSTGTGTTLPQAVASGNAGVMSGADKAKLDGIDKAKLDGIASGAEVNVQSDWNAVSGDAFILNKPAISAGIDFANDWLASVSSSSGSPSSIGGSSGMTAMDLYVSYTNTTNTSRIIINHSTKWFVAIGLATGVVGTYTGTITSSFPASGSPTVPFQSATQGIYLRTNGNDYQIYEDTTTSLAVISCRF